jgi:hypothetical protein
VLRGLRLKEATSVARLIADQRRFYRVPHPVCLRQACGLLAAAERGPVLTVGCVHKVRTAAIALNARIKCGFCRRCVPNTGELT